MTTLRQKLIDELELRGMSRSTQESYVGVVSMLARHYHRAPDLNFTLRNQGERWLREEYLAYPAARSACCRKVMGISETIELAQFLFPTAT